MASQTKKLAHTFAGLAFAGLSACTFAAGFQRALAADPDGQPLQIGIWYPSSAVPAPITVGTANMSVARDGPVQGQALPLVVISHGTGGSFLGHVDTAVAMADAGYVVVALTHRGDNYADNSRSAYVMDRPRQVSRVIDHMLSVWGSQAAIDPARIGMFGFSSGAFTALLSIGGIADYSKIGSMCQQNPGDFACQLIAKQGQAIPVLADARPADDPRIRAAVVAAPALGFTLSPNGLKNVKVPVQLWRAEDDIILPHPRYAEAVRLALPQAPDYRVVPKAGHFDFMSICSPALAAIAPAICASGPGFDRAVFQRSFNVSVIEFFDKTLKAR
jgi:predicted dienelactone hydrolase